MADFKNPWAKGGKYYPTWIEETNNKVLDTSKLFGNGDGDNSSQTTKSKYKILLFGGVDYYNEGVYGTNKKLAQYIETIALSSKYNIPLQKGDIQVVNSPLFSNEVDGKDVYKEILEIVKKNFDYNNGTLILYGYSWGG